MQLLVFTTYDHYFNTQQRVNKAVVHRARHAELAYRVFDFCSRLLKRPSASKSIQYRYRENTNALSIKHFRTLHLFDGLKLAPRNFYTRNKQTELRFSPPRII